MLFWDALLLFLLQVLVTSLLYISNTSCVGLCAGGGGAWGGLKVEGLEKALLAQVYTFHVKIVLN